ncbi:unnamed protein product, partial [Arabidopsis halleri]
FRRLFLSLHQNSTSWLLWCCRRKEELLRFYGCEAWDLPESIASIIPQISLFYSNGLVLIKGYHRHCFVGNPVLQQWVKIPPSPNDSSRVYCLVTRVDDDGVLLSFKVVWFASLRTTSNNLSCTLSVLLYSSETGLWASKITHCPHQITSLTDYVTVNGTNYYSSLIQPGVLVAHDFYSETDQFRVIPLPDHPNHSDDRDLKRRALTTSGGFLMCMRTLAQKEETVLKVWRLNNNNDDSWQLLWKIASRCL